MALHSARSRPAPATAPDVWLGMVSSGLAAWSELTQAMVDQSAAQTRAFADLCTSGLDGLRGWPTQQQLLLMVENQAEQLAEGCRHTLDDLEQQGRPTLPLALPD